MKKQDQKIEYLKRLETILKQGVNKDKKGVRITFTDLQASPSGMSRKFKMYVVSKKGEFYNITFLVSKLMDETFTNDDKIRVYGCGMDMLFNTLYNLNLTIYQLKGHKKYKHEIAYHGYVDTNYNLL